MGAAIASAGSSARPADAAATEPTPCLGATPFLAFDVEKALERYDQLCKVLPGTAVHYAVKANPNQRLLWRLARLGARFDVASPGEVDLCLTAGATATDLVYSNPVKRPSDVAMAYSQGLRVFVVDSMSELNKVATHAPGVSVLARMVTSGAGSDWPLSRKFGARADDCLTLLSAAPGLGLDAAGLAFHVGSQQHDPRAWDAPIDTSARIFARLRRTGIKPWLLDLGGGFPAAHEGDIPDLAEFGAAIGAALRTSFPQVCPQTMAEPGRAVVADAGVLVASVLAVIMRDGIRWVYLDAGVFTGLVETLDEAIRYRIRTHREGPVGPAVLAGPTCDSADVLYEHKPVLLPLDLREGDEVRLMSAGAYTTSYASVGFNGFPPLPTHLVDELP